MIGKRMETRIISFMDKEEAYKDGNLDVKLEIALDFTELIIRKYYDNNIIIEEKWTARKNGKVGLIFLVTGEKIKAVYIKKYIATIDLEKYKTIINYYKEKQELKIALEMDCFETFMFGIIRKKLVGMDYSMLNEENSIDCTELLKFMKKLVYKDNFVII